MIDTTIKVIGGWAMQDFIDAANMLVEYNEIPTYTQEHLEDAFDKVDHDFDANVGINWLIIERAIKEAVNGE